MASTCQQCTASNWGSVAHNNILEYIYITYYSFLVNLLARFTNDKYLFRLQFYGFINIYIFTAAICSTDLKSSEQHSLRIYINYHLIDQYTSIMEWFHWWPNFARFWWFWTGLAEALKSACSSLCPGQRMLTLLFIYGKFQIYLILKRVFVAETDNLIQPNLPVSVHHWWAPGDSLLSVGEDQLTTRPWMWLIHVGSYAERATPQPSSVACPDVPWYTGSGILTPANVW